MGDRDIAHDRIMTRSPKCAQPRTSPLQWHFYRNENGDDVVGRDELRALLRDPTITNSVRIDRLARLKELTESAAAGRLDYEDDLKAIARDPYLWELRWETESGAPWRMYHAEPDILPSHLVALRVHEKYIAGTDDEVRERQNDQIQVASDRYREGEPRAWGL